VSFTVVRLASVFETPGARACESSVARRAHSRRPGAYDELVVTRAQAEVGVFRRLRRGGLFEAVPPGAVALMAPSPASRGC
jgi:hypothetical protein